MTTHALVIGLGNEYRSDDAVGRAVARKLKASAGDEFCVKEESGEGGALMEDWKDADFVVLVDAVESGGLPGTIRRMDARTTVIPIELFHCSAHGFGVSEGIELARALKRLPAHLIVYGIEGRSFALGVGLSPEVEAAADEVVGRVKDELAALSDMKSKSHFMDRSRLRNEVSLPDRLLKFLLRRKRREKSCFFFQHAVAVSAGCRASGRRCEPGFPTKIQHGLPSPNSLPGTISDSRMQRGPAYEDEEQDH